MELGMKSNEVKLSKYDPDWKVEFERIKKELVQTTSLEAYQIEHIGSTSIIGMEAKPIIDILIGVDDLESRCEEYKSAFKKLNIYRLRVKREGEIVLAIDQDGLRTHYIHMVELHSNKWNDLLTFRNFLNENEEYKEEYRNLKSSIIENDSAVDIKKYTNLKEPFVNKIIPLSAIK